MPQKGSRKAGTPILAVTADNRDIMSELEFAPTIRNKTQKWLHEIKVHLAHRNKSEQMRESNIDNNFYLLVIHFIT